MNKLKIIITTEKKSLEQNNINFTNDKYNEKQKILEGKQNDDILNDIVINTSKENNNNNNNQLLNRKRNLEISDNNIDV